MYYEHYKDTIKVQMQTQKKVELKFIGKKIIQQSRFLSIIEIN